MEEQNENENESEEKQNENENEIQSVPRQAREPDSAYSWSTQHTKSERVARVIISCLRGNIFGVDSQLSIKKPKSS